MEHLKNEINEFNQNSVGNRSFTITSEGYMEMYVGDEQDLNSISNFDHEEWRCHFRKQWKEPK